jgi:phosphoadenosine phosphosulfate reductase
LCKTEGKTFVTDLKPVFPEELKIYSNVLPGIGNLSFTTPTNFFRFRNKIFGNGKVLFSFYINGNELKFDVKNKYHCNELLPIKQILHANRRKLEKREDEAIKFIRKVAKQHKDKHILVSFSGGKDSSVTAYLVHKALGKVTLVFSNTGIEFPETVKFVREFARKMKFDLVELNPPKNFFEICNELGPPSRMMRWCCFTQKSTPINDYYATLDKPILSFDGIRKAESKSRAKFEKIRKNTKIIKQYSAYPIFDWSDFEVWLYILWKKLPINPLYYYGFSRVGCFVCPNNGKFDEFLLKRIHPELYKEWEKILVSYASKNGKTLDWVYNGEWKQRKTKYKKFEVCTIQNTCTVGNKFVFILNGHKVTENLLEFFKVFGKKNKKISNGETFIQFIGSDILISAIVGDKTIRVKINDGKKLNRKLFEVTKQLEKALNCINCGGCIGSCPYGAIKINNNKFMIDETKCRHCLTCITSKYIKQACISLHYKPIRNVVNFNL